MVDNVYYIRNKEKEKKSNTALAKEDKYDEYLEEDSIESVSSKKSKCDDDSCKKSKCDDDPCKKPDRVVGKGTCQELVEREIIFDPPKKDAVIEIEDIKRTVDLTIVEACTDNVIINGCLHKNIIYKTMKRPEKSQKDEHGKKEDKEDHEDKKDKKEGPTCETVVDDCVVVDGVVRHTTVWIPFKCFIPVPGARKGDTVEVLFAGVGDGCFVEIPIFEEEFITTPIFCSANEKPFIKGLIEKDLIRVTVRVIRP